MGASDNAGHIGYMANSVLEAADYVRSTDLLSYVLVDATLGSMAQNGRVRYLMRIAHGRAALAGSRRKNGAKARVGSVWTTTLALSFVAGVVSAIVWRVVNRRPQGAAPVAP
jgi:hypothetical protein